jgi:hypothetical protein
LAVPVDIAMVAPKEVGEYKPMPSKLRRKYVRQIESEDENSHIESEDDDFVTLNAKALRKKSLTQNGLIPTLLRQ